MSTPSIDDPTAKFRCVCGTLCVGVESMEQHLGGCLAGKRYAMFAHLVREAEAGRLPFCGTQHDKLEA